MFTRIMTETVADRIRERLALTGQTEHGASLKAGGSPSLIPNIINGRSKNPRLDTLRKIAEALDTTAEWLSSGEPAPSQQASQPPASMPAIGASDAELVQLHALANVFQLPNTLPVLGTALGSIIAEGMEGFAFSPGDVAGYVRRPSLVANVREAYAVVVKGDSMARLHNDGEARVANPLRHPAPGDSVIIITSSNWEDDPGQAYIKILRRRTERSVFVEQLNPAITIEIPTLYVKSIHYVLTANEVLGF